MQHSKPLSHNDGDRKTTSAPSTHQFRGRQTGILLNDDLLGLLQVLLSPLRLLSLQQQQETILFTQQGFQKLIHTCMQQTVTRKTITCIVTTKRFHLQMDIISLLFQPVNETSFTNRFYFFTISKSLFTNRFYLFTISKSSFYKPFFLSLQFQWVYLQINISLQFQREFIYKPILFLYSFNRFTNRFHFFSFKESSFANKFYFFTVSKSEGTGLPCEIIIFITMFLKSCQPHQVTLG